MPRRPRPLPPALQETVFTPADLRAFGIPLSRVRASDVMRLERGLFRQALRTSAGTGVAGQREETTTNTPPWDLERARAVLRLRPDASLSDLSAAQWHRLPLPRWAEAHSTLHVATSKTHRLERPGVQVHRRVTAGEDVVVRGGLRCTSPIRTLWDLCAPSSGLTFDDLVVIADSLMPQEWIAGFGLGEVRVGRDDLNDVRNRMGRFRGSRRAREVAELMREAVGSPQETRTRLALLDAGFPEPEVALPLKDEQGFAGPIVDMAYPQWKVVIQYEGERHRTREQQERDVRRDRWCELHGWKVIKVTAADLHNGLREVLPVLRTRIAEMG